MLSALLALLLASCSETNSDPVVARSTLGPIRCSQLTSFASALSPKRAGALLEEGSASTELLQSFVLREAFAQEAIDSGAENDPDIQDSLRALEVNWLTRQWEQAFTREQAPSDQEIASFYQQHSDSFSSPERIATRFILIREDGPAAPQSLLNVRQRALSGESFADLARRFSDAENAGRGGAVATSPRGTLLEAYEEVAWSLQPGEISEPLRLPDGWAIVLLEKRFPARSMSPEEAAPVIEKRLAREYRQERRKTAVAEAKERWEVSVDWDSALRGDLAGDEVIVRIGDQPLTLDAMHLAHRPPFLRQLIDDRVERHLLLALGRERFGDWLQEPRGQEAYRLRLASSAKRRRILQELESMFEQTDLRKARSEHAAALEQPEQRVFEVVISPGTSGSMREALEEARRLSGEWTAEEVIPTPHERWGPLTREQLAAATSPALARLAFTLGYREVSAPVLLERYNEGSSRFAPQGYVLLRLTETRPPTPKPAEDTQPRLLLYLGRNQISEIESRLQSSTLEALAIEPSPDRLAACPMPSSLE